jgi:hypothetical protein
MRALSNCHGHEPVAVLTGNHNHFFDYYFTRRLNLSLLDGFLKLQEKYYQENYGQTKNKEQRDKNNQRRINHGSHRPQITPFFLQMEHWQTAQLAPRLTQAFVFASTKQQKPL